MLLGMCKTRWSERDVSCEHFYLALPSIVEALEIINGTHPSIKTFDEIFTKGWDSNSKKEAAAYINALTSFGFIVGLTSLCRLLHPVASITKKLQGRTVDIVKAYQKVILKKSFWLFTDKQNESPQDLMFHHQYQGLFQGK